MNVWADSAVSTNGRQYLSIRYTERLAEAGAVTSVGSRGDSYDNALAESVIGLYKAELVHRRGPWRGLDDLELATLEWVDWYNRRRLHSALDYLPPAVVRPQIWASDFFTVQTLWFQTLYVFFFIAHDRRTLMHVNVTSHPKADWVWRQLIQATPWATGPRFLIRDRDRSYGGDFVARARRIGIETVLTPIASPQ